MILLLALAVVAIHSWAAGPALAQGERPRFDVRVFAQVPEPGYPEPVAVASDGTVYVGTNQPFLGSYPGPSKVFAFSSSGSLLREYPIEGQDLIEEHGVQGLALDAQGQLYVLDRSREARVLVLDPRTGAQREYARFRDLPTCADAGRRTDCSATAEDREAGPDYAVFAPSGDLFVSDITQGLIWRVPRGGGDPAVWVTDSRFDHGFGPNGMQFRADGSLLLAVTMPGPNTGDPFAGGIYAIAVRPDGGAGEVTEFWRSRTLDGPDGFAIGRSGTVYLALAVGNALVVISPTGEEIDRIPANPVLNAIREAPFESPASVAFDGNRLLVSNQAIFTQSPARFVVFDVYAGEPGLPLHHPLIRTASRPRIRLSISPRRVRPGRHRFRLLTRVGRARLPEALVRLAGSRARTNSAGRATMRVRLPRAGHHRATASKTGYRRGTATVTVRRSR